MSDELPDVPALRSIDPPPGGLTRLRAAIEEDTERRRSRVRWWFAVVPVAAVIALVMWSRRPGDEAALTIESAPAAIADPSISPTFYWVGSTERVAPPAAVTYIDVTATQPIEQVQLR
jgi:hypothetical protein